MDDRAFDSKANERRRAVVTGIGMVSPLGLNTRSTWEALCSGRCGIGAVSHFDCSAFPTKIAGEVKDWDRRVPIDRKLLRTLNRGAQFIARAAIDAWQDSGIEEGSGDHIGVVVAHSGARSTPERFLKLYHPSGRLPKLNPLHEIRNSYSTIGGVVGALFGATGPNLVINTACASGSQAVGLAMRMIRDGEADCVVAGGGDAMITPLDMLGFCAIGAMSTRNDDPRAACRPFDKERDGFVLGEGAAILVLEENSRARERGARIYGEVCGYGSSLNAYKVTDSPPDGLGQYLAMRSSLDDARLPPNAIDYINAHGTGTKDNDASETIAIKRALNGYASSVLISSTKGATGHLVAGAGAIEACFCLLSMRDGVIPPTLNLSTPDPNCDLNYCPLVSVKRDVNTCLSNSFGFGGTNASLVLSLGT